MMSSMIQRIALVWSMSGLVFAQSYSDDPRLKTLPTRVNVALKRHPELLFITQQRPLSSWVISMEIISPIML